MPELDQNTLNAARTVNQFIDLAGSDKALKVSNDGRVSTRNSLWNKIISYFRRGPTQEANQRTAQLFKEKLLTVARTYEYKSGFDIYHPQDIFHHFAGFDSDDRAQAVEAVLNSGILNEELNQGKPLTGRKVQEVLAEIDYAANDFARNQRDTIFSQVEQGIGLYRESRHKFQEAFFDPAKLEASNLDAFNIAQQDLANVSNKLDALITNLRQDLNRLIDRSEQPNLDDMTLARDVFRQMQHAAALKSEADLFNSEAKAYGIINDSVEPLLRKFEAALPHLDAIELNFADLNEEQLKARDDLREVIDGLNQPLGKLGNSLKTAKGHLEDGGLHNAEHLPRWKEFQKFVEDKTEEIKAIRAKASQAFAIKTTAQGLIKSIDVRNEESHIKATEIITKDELDALDREISRLEKASKNPSTAREPQKSALKTRVSSESLNQIRHGKKVQISSTISLSRAGLEGAEDDRQSIEKSKDGDDDLSEFNEAGDEFGVRDPATNQLRRDTFSNMAKASRLSNAVGDAAKAAKANQGVRDFQALQNTLSAVQDFANKYAFDSAAIKAYALENNIDISKLSPNHQELYKTILFYEFKAIATDSPHKFNDEGLQKVAKKFFAQIASRDDAAAQASLARFRDLNEAGKTLLASISNESVKELSDRRQAMGPALLNYLKKINSPEIMADLVVQEPGERFGADEVGLANIAAADIAFSGIRGATLELLFEDALKEGSPLRLAYLATGSQDKNPAVNNNDSLNAALIDLTQGLNFIVQQLGQNAGLSNQTVGSAIRSFSESFNGGNFQDFTNPNATTVPPQAREIFDTLTPFLQQRAEFIRNTAQNFDQ